MRARVVRAALHAWWVCRAAWWRRHKPPPCVPRAPTVCAPCVPWPPQCPCACRGPRCECGRAAHGGWDGHAADLHPGCRREHERAASRGIERGVTFALRMRDRRAGRLAARMAALTAPRPSRCPARPSSGGGGRPGRWRARRPAEPLTAAANVGSYVLAPLSHAPSGVGGDAGGGGDVDGDGGGRVGARLEEVDPAHRRAQARAAAHSGGADIGADPARAALGLGLVDHNRPADERGLGGRLGEERRGQVGQHALVRRRRGRQVAVLAGEVADLVLAGDGHGLARDKERIEVAARHAAAAVGR
eukprot:4560380-Prymnesium_polylepis.1